MSDTADRDAIRRREMVQRQIASRGVGDERLLEAMRVVPREAFVSEEMAEFAYEDSALPIEAEQTISQPYIVGAVHFVPLVSTGSGGIEPAGREDAVSAGPR